MPFSLYYALHALGFITALAYVWIIAPKYHLGRLKSEFMAICVYTVSYLWMLILYWLITGVFGGQNVVRIFIFIPIFLVLYCGIFGVNIPRAMDMCAPVPCIAQAIAKFGCMDEGCCYSWLHVKWGIYQSRAGAKVFPVQLAEGLTALAIAIFLIIIARKKHYDVKGLCMPWMLILFGSTRFVWEFFRANHKLFLGISELALWSLAMTAVGVIWVILQRKKQEKDLTVKENNVTI